MLPAAYHIQKPFVITFSKIYDTIGVSASPFICLCLCICLCICICICLCIWIFVRIWIADIMGFQKIYDLRGPWGLTAVFQLIYELRKNCCGRTGGRTDGRTDRGSIRGPRGPKKLGFCHQCLDQRSCSKIDFSLVLLNEWLLCRFTKRKQLRLAFSSTVISTRTWKRWHCHNFPCQK